MMLDKVSAGQQENSGVYSLLAGTSSGLLASQQQHSAAPAHIRAQQIHKIPTYNEKPGSSTSTAVDRLSLRPGAQPSSAQLHRPSQQQQHAQHSRHGTKPQSPRSPRSPAGHGKLRSQRTSAPGSPGSTAPAPGSPHASSPRVSGAGSRPSTPPRVAAFTAEEILRAARCQDPAPAAPSPRSSPPQEKAPSAKPAPTAAPAAGLSVQPQEQQRQEQRYQSANQQHLLQQQPRAAGALPQPLLQHGQAGTQRSQHWCHSPLRFSQQQQQQQQQLGVQLPPSLQQQKQQQDSADSAPEAEASFGYLACGPGSRQDSPNAVAAVAACTAGVRCPGQAPASRQVRWQHGEAGIFGVQEGRGQSLGQGQLQGQGSSQGQLQLPEQLQQEDCQVVQPGDQRQQQAVCLEQPGQPQEQQQQQQQQQQQHGILEMPQQEQPHKQDRAADAAAVEELQHLQQQVMQSAQLLEQQQQGPQQQQQQQDNEEAQLCSQDVLNRPRDVSPEKQQQLLARLCAKHGLPLPHPRNLSKKQQRQPGSLWGPDKQQQQTARLTLRGGQVARKRDELLQQLRHSSVNRRSQQLVPGAHPPTAAAAGDRPALCTVGNADSTVAGAQQQQLAQKDTQPDEQQHEEQQMVAAYGQAVTMPSSVSQLHLVDGLQYVHALLGSIRMPSAGSTAAAAAGGAGGEGTWQCSLPIAGGDAQLLLPGPQRSACLPAAPAAAAAAGSIRGCHWGQQQELDTPDQQQQSSGERSQQQQQQQQPVWLKGAGAGQLRELCSSALARLSATARPGHQQSTDTGSTQHNLHEYGSNSNRHYQLNLPLEDAMVLLGLVSSTQDPSHHHLQQQQQQHVKQTQQVQECFAALHAAVKQHLRPPEGDPLHQQLQPSWHKQQRRQLAQGCCWGPRQLGIRAAAAVAAAQQAWVMEQELLPLWQCLRQVQQQLWRQQALAEAGASSSVPQRKQPGSPTKAARQGAIGSPTTPGSPSKRTAATAAATAAASPHSARARTPPRSRLSTGRAVIAPASSPPRKQPLAATVVAKRLTVGALLRGTADLAVTCAGWEGTPLLIKLLCDLRNKLLCKLALQALRVAVTDAAQRDALLTVQLPIALSALNLSAGFRAWRAWAGDRSGVRGVRQQLREKVRSHRAVDALRAWREAAQASAWLRARGEALRQQRQQMLRAKALKAWRCARLQQQVDLAQHALAVLWRARVTVAQVLMAWAREARQAVLLAAMAWDESDSGELSSANTSSNPSRRQSSSSAAFERCSRDLAAALELQRPWRERMLGAVADTQQRCAEAFEAAGQASTELRAALPPLLVSAQVILQAWQQQRRLKVQQQLQALGADSSDDGGREVSGSAARQPRAEWSAQLLADDSSSYVLPFSGTSSRCVSDECAGELHGSLSVQEQHTRASALPGHYAHPAAAVVAAVPTAATGDGPAAAAAADGEVHGVVQLQQPGVRKADGRADSSTASQQEALQPGSAVAAAAAALGPMQHTAAAVAGLEHHALAELSAAAAAGVAVGVGARAPLPSGSESTAAAAAGSIPTAGSAAAEQQCAQDSCSAGGPAAAGSSSEGPCGTWHTTAAAAAAAAVPNGSIHAAGAAAAAAGAPFGDPGANGNADGCSPRGAAGGAAPAAAAAAAAGVAVQGGCQYSSDSMQDSPGVVTSRPQSRVGSGPTAAAAAAGEAGLQGAGFSTSSESNWSSASPAVQPTAAAAAAGAGARAAGAAAAAGLGGGAGGAGGCGDVVSLARRLQELLCRTAANPAAATLQAAAAAMAAAAAPAVNEGSAPPSTSETAAADGEVRTSVQLQQPGSGDAAAAAAAAPADGSSSVLGRDGAADDSSSSSGCSVGAVAAAVESLCARSLGQAQQQQPHQQPCHLEPQPDTMLGQASGHAAAAAAAAAAVAAVEVGVGVGSPRSQVGSPKGNGIAGQDALGTQPGQHGQPLGPLAAAAAAVVTGDGLNALPEHPLGDGSSSQASHDAGAAGDAATMQHASPEQQQQQQQQFSALGPQGNSSSSSPTATLPDAEHSLQTLLSNKQQQLLGAAAAAESLREHFCEDPPMAAQQQQQLRKHQHIHKSAAAAAADASRVLSDSDVLQCALRHWVWLVRGRSLLVRVFSGAEAAWQDRARQEVQAVLDPGSGPHVQAFRLMRRVFDAWAAHTATRLQGAAAMAAGEAAAAYHSSRLAVRAWRAWRQYLAQAPAVQQRYSSALASLCLLGWYQHMLQQRQDPHSRGRLRAVLRSRSGGCCGSEQQWWRYQTLRRVVQGWRGLVVRGDEHYRLRLLASSMVSWQLAVEDTQQLLAAFHSRWQHQRLLQHSLLLWRSLVLLLKQQRQETTRAESWHAQRLAGRVLTAWGDLTAVAAAERGAVAAAVRNYKRRLMRKKLLQWSLVACASSAARVYYQHGLMQRVMGAWRGQVAAAADALQHELQQQQQQQQQHYEGQQQQYVWAGVAPGGWGTGEQQQGYAGAGHHQQQQQGAWQQQQLQQVSGQHLLPPPLSDHLQQQQHHWPQQQQQMLQAAVCCPGVISSSSSWSPIQQQQQRQQHSTGVTHHHSSPGSLGAAGRVTPDASAAAAAVQTSMSCPGGLSVNRHSSGGGASTQQGLDAFAGMQPSSTGLASTQQCQQLQRARAAAGLGHKLPPWLMAPEQGLQGSLGSLGLQDPTSLGGSGGVWSQPDCPTRLIGTSGGRSGSFGDGAAAPCGGQQGLPQSPTKQPTRPDVKGPGGHQKLGGREAACRNSSSGGGSSSSTGRRGSVAVPGAKHAGAAAARRGEHTYTGAAVVAVAAVGKGSPQGRRNVGGAGGVGPAGRNAAAGEATAAAVAPTRRGWAGSGPALKADAGICSSPVKLRPAVVQHTQLKCTGRVDGRIV